MSNNSNKTDYRYVNDLRRLAYSQGKLIEQKKFLILLGIAAIFLILVAVAVEQYISLGSEQTFILVAASVVFISCSFNSFLIDGITFPKYCFNCSVSLT